jgi:hypothetical protein
MHRAQADEAPLLNNTPEVFHKTLDTSLQVKLPYGIVPIRSKLVVKTERGPGGTIRFKVRI